MDEAVGELSALIADVGSLDDASAQLDAWTENTAIFDRLGDVIFVTTALADMAGQLMVAGREAELVKLAKGEGEDAAATPRPVPFLDLPWEDAINAFKKRGLVTERDFDTLLRGYAQRSAVARKLMLKQIQAELMRYLTDSIEEGGTFPEFSKRVNALTDELGIGRGQPHYLQMVFRTNVQSAYGAGRFKAIRNPVIVQTRPYVQYRTVGDSRVRDEHAVLDGKTYAADDPVWQRIAPPNGFNCRCSMITLSRSEAAGLDISTDIPEGYIPTPGFDQPPMPELDVLEPAAEDESEAG